MALRCFGLLAAFAMVSAMVLADQSIGQPIGDSLDKAGDSIDKTQWHADMKACAALRNESERLACYDRLAAVVDSGVVPQQAGWSPQDMFGVQGQLSRESSPRRATDREEIRAVSALVTTLSKSGDGSLLIETDNGQVWRQEGSAELMLTVGDTVIISRAAMSSFRLSTPTKRHARVKRVK